MTDTPTSLVPPEQAIRHFLEAVERPARLLVAISGGSDSLGLLTVLADCLGGASADGIELLAATIDHQLRPESTDEARTVASICLALGIPHVIRDWAGKKPRSGISAAAREARYGLLMQAADEIGATAILTGHTLDDQRETVLMRAARRDGDGNLGLAGMAPAVLLQRRRWMLRPFLCTRRADIRAYLRQRGMTWIDDPSNADPHYERVRTRNDLAQAQDAVGVPDAQAAAERTELSDDAAEWIGRHVTLRHGVLARVALPGLEGDVVIQRHALATLAAVLGGRVHGMKSESMDRLTAFIGSGLPGRLTAGRVIFDRRREGLYMQREKRGLLPLHVAAGDEGIWDGRYRIRNASAVEVSVSADRPDRDGATTLFADVPASVALRAMAVMPRLERFAASPDHRVDVEPIIAPFDRFLPQFELNVARQFAVLLGCDDFPLPPAKVSVRKS